MILSLPPKNTNIFKDNISFTQEEINNFKSINFVHMKSKQKLQKIAEKTKQNRTINNWYKMEQTETKQNNIKLN